MFLSLKIKRKKIIIYLEWVLLFFVSALGKSYVLITEVHRSQRNIHRNALKTHRLFYGTHKVTSCSDRTYHIICHSHKFKFRLFVVTTLFFVAPLWPTYTGLSDMLLYQNMNYTCLHMSLHILQLTMWYIYR